jgi:hypothetical protein
MPKKKNDKKQNTGSKKKTVQGKSFNFVKVLS